MEKQSINSALLRETKGFTKCSYNEGSNKNRQLIAKTHTCDLDKE